MWRFVLGGVFVFLFLLKDYIEKLHSDKSKKKIVNSPDQRQLSRRTRTDFRTSLSTKLQRVNEKASHRLWPMFGKGSADYETLRCRSAPMHK